MHPREPFRDQSPATRDPSELLAEMARAQEKLESLERELEHSHRLVMLGTLAAGIAHEFNNILTPAVNVAELALANREDGKRTIAALERSAEAIMRATDIAHAILAFSRDTDDPATFHMERSAPSEWCEVGNAVQEAILLLGAAPRRQGISINVEVEPPCYAQIKSIGLEQVLLNLFLNAVKAMPDGGSLSIRADSGDASDGSAVRRKTIIEVEDTGCGIAANRLERIFDSFTTATPDGPGSGGHGLGLMVCRHLIESAGGTIKAMSVVGEGSTFRIELDAADAPRQTLRRSA